MGEVFSMGPIQPKTYTAGRMEAVRTEIKMGLQSGRNTAAYRP